MNFFVECRLSIRLLLAGEIIDESSHKKVCAVLEIYDAITQNPVLFVGLRNSLRTA